MFDAWGSIAQVQDGNNNILNVLTILDRGYTGHEHLQSVGLIDMNARLYDPKLHRFLQPDNYVQDPSNTQNYNRYGYVLNNPLKYTDPSGEVTGVEELVVGAITANPVIFGIGVAIMGASVLANNWDKWHMKDFFNHNVSNGFKDAVNFIGRNIYSLFGGGGAAPAMQVAQQSNMSANITPSASNNFSTGAVSIRNNAMVSQYEEHSIIPANTISSQVGTMFSTAGVIGDAGAYSTGSFSLVRSGMIRPNYYSSGWRGNGSVTAYELSSLGGKISAGAGLVNTGMSYYNIVNGTASPITYVDAGIGSAGVYNTALKYVSPADEIPVVGEFVAFYGLLRLSWDFGSYMGERYGPSTWFAIDDEKLLK